MAFRVSQNLQRICRFILYIANAFFIPLGLAVVGIGLYLLLYKADLLSVVFHMSYIQDTIIIVIVCGAVIPLLGLFGLVATRISMFRVLAAYCILLLLVALLLIVAGVMGIIIKTAWHIDEVRQNMRDTIQQNYGVDIGTNEYNAHITYTWDTVQQWWYCCAVEDNSWSVYRQSEWYNRQPGDPGNKDLTAMMVPQSCCAKDQYGNYYIKQQCQNWQVGPPNIQTGQTNEALHYKGCFTEGQGILDLVSSGAMGVGLCVGLLLFAGIVPAAILVIGLIKTKPKLPPQATSSRAYYVPSAPHATSSHGGRQAASSYDNPYISRT